MIEQSGCDEKEERADIQGRIKAAVVLKPGEGENSLAATANVHRETSHSICHAGHPITHLTWRRRKLLGGHCECLEKQALEYVIIELLKHEQNTQQLADRSSTSSQARRRRKLLGGHCECLEKQALGFNNHQSNSCEVSDIQGRINTALALKPGEGESSKAATANQDTEKRADKVKRMDELNVRDMFIPKALGGTAKGADNMGGDIAGWSARPMRPITTNETLSQNHPSPIRSDFNPHYNNQLWYNLTYGRLSEDNKIKVGELIEKAEKKCRHSVTGLLNQARRILRARHNRSVPVVKGYLERYS
ncbi:hypothetical protein V8G54_002750 [Vigna mungo]|uniref:Uncharacterized protein n=1 Tax=Vigna mungo TaxID=3915 RepID=A0AAQ3P8U9_VIGMU